MRRTVDRALSLPAALLAGTGAYLLVLLAAAAAAPRRRAPRPSAAPSTRLVVLVPAHDEEAVIGSTAAALAALGAETIVVADNCSDGTAGAARAAGATVWERADPQRPGKGHALEWAFERVARERPDVEAVVVVDADCHPSPNLVDAIADRIGSGAAAVQVAYTVAHPEAAPAVALRYAGFALVNVVRPRGKDALGLSAGLLGSGMAFTLDLLRRVPWSSHGLAEDAEQHLRIVAAGERVAFAHEAWVESPMPGSLAGSASQQRRWEGGRLAAARAGAALALDGLRTGSPARVHAGLEPLVPPQSVIAGGGAALAAVGLVLRLPRTAALALVALAAQAAFVVGGLALVRAPGAVWRALLHAPRLVVFKLPVYLRAAAGARSGEWVRTPRG